MRAVRFTMDKNLPLGFEDLHLGARWVSSERIVKECDIQQFADLTGDQDPLHTDPEFAANGPFGRPIAHGLLGMSFLAGLSSRAPCVQTNAFVSVKSWNFSRPVYAGDRVHAVTEIIDLKPQGRRRGEVHWYRQLINQDGQKVQEGVFVTLVARRIPLTLHRQRIGEMSNSGARASSDSAASVTLS